MGLEMQMIITKQMHLKRFKLFSTIPVPVFLFKNHKRNEGKGITEQKEIKHTCILTLAPRDTR